MTIVPAQPDTRFYLDHHDVSGFLNAGNQSWDSELIESGNFLTAAPVTTASGKYTEKAGETILFDGAVNQIDAILEALAYTDAPHYRGRQWGAHAEGNVAYETIEKLVSKPIAASEGQLLMINAAWAQAGPTSRGKILRNATVVGTGSGPGQNQGAIVPATAVYQAVIRVLGGVFTSITVEVHQSATDSGYALMAGMTHTFTAPGVVRLTFTGASSAWKRAVVTAFAGTNAIVVVTGGRVHGT